MENLHLKNIEESQIDMISTNRNYLNSIFKTKNLTFDEFSKKLVLHRNHKPDEKQELLDDLYEIYKLNIENYQYITLLLKNYNYEKKSSKEHYQKYTTSMIAHYIIEQIIKKLFTKKEQLSFYQYLEDLTKLHDEKYLEKPFNRNNEPILNNYSINKIIFLCIKKLKKENLLNIKPKNLNIKLTKEKKENISQQIHSTLPKNLLKSIKYEKLIEKFIEKLHYLNIVTEI